MSGPKSSTVSYQPTAAQIRAARRAQLMALSARAAEFAERCSRMQAEWRDRAPVNARALAAIEAPAVAVVGAGEDPAPALAAGAAALRRSEATLASVVNLCVQEEVRAIARKGATDSELAAATRSAGASRVSARRDGTPDLEDEDAPTAVLEPVDSLPSADTRAERVAAIVGRATVALESGAVEACTRQALAATDQIAFYSALAHARRIVEAAEAAAQSQARAQAEAGRLLESLVGLSGDPVDHWRDVLTSAAGGRGDLPVGAGPAVDLVRRAAVRARLLEVLATTGCEPVADGEDALVGYVEQPGGGATKVRLDREGVLFTPVSESALDPPAARRLDEANCAYYERVQAGAAAAGVNLDLVSQRAVGEAPVRVESHPFATTAPVPPKLAKRRRPATDTLRRKS